MNPILPLSKLYFSLFFVKNYTVYSSIINQKKEIMSIVNQHQYLWEGGIETSENSELSFKITLFYEDQSEESFYESSRKDLTEDHHFHQSLLSTEDVIDFAIELDGIIA